MAELLLNRYDLVEKRGESTFADLFMAIDTRAGKIVALKLLREPFASTTSFAERYTEEARILAGLDHPHIARLYDYGPVEPGGDAGYYLATQYIEGASLEGYLARHGILPPLAAIQIVIQVLQGLSAAHAKRIIHRDLRPHNILLANDNHVVLTDFGIAVTLVSLADPQFPLAVARYLAPEQAQQRLVTPATDIYSAGVMLFVILTGRYPFEAATPVETALKHVMQAPPLPRDLNPSIPPALQSVVLRAMAKLPEQRYQSAEAMIDALQKVALGANESTGYIPRVDSPTEAFPPTSFTLEETQVMPVVPADPKHE